MKTGRQLDSTGVFLADDEVDEFRALWERHTGLRLPPDDARVLSGQLLRLLALIRDVAVTVVSSENEAVDRPSCQNAGADQSIEVSSS